MDTFTAEKFGTDNASSEQDSKMSLKQLEDLQEDTLEKQEAGETVHDEDEGEESDIEEIEDYDDDYNESINNKLNRIEDNMNWGDPGPEIHDDVGYVYDNNLITRTEKPTFEKQVDPRWYNDEYVLLNEEVDWDKIESDPKQLFTVGNSKVGKDTIIFNLQPARFCPSFENGMCKIVKADEDGNFRIACYAYQDERQYKVALQLRLRQMRFWDTHTSQEIYDKMSKFYKLVHGGSMTYATLKARDEETATSPMRPAVKAKTKSKKLKYIRFNQSGDLKDVDDAKKMDEVARLAKEGLGLSSYTYTARKDILKEYKFQYVHIQGSGFLAATGLSKSIRNKFGKQHGAFVGKIFQAFPTIRNKSGKLVERVNPNKLYYEDIMYSHLDKDGIPTKRGGIKRNPRFNKWSHSNEKGWYACRGDCNDCYACKKDEIKHIAVKIHRSFQKVSDKWHDMETTPEGGYKVRQKFDPYEREALTGAPLQWSTEMEDEYENTSELIRKEKEFNALPHKEQVEFLTYKLNELYSLYLDTYGPNVNRKEMDDEEKTTLDNNKKKIANWEKKAEKRDININDLRKKAGMPPKGSGPKVKKEDVEKYGTEEEKTYLKESFVRDVKMKAREFLNRLIGEEDWKLRAKTWGDPFGYGGHVVVTVENWPWKKYGIFVRELKNLAKKAGFSFNFGGDWYSYDSSTNKEEEGVFDENQTEGSIDETN